VEANRARRTIPNGQEQKVPNLYTALGFPIDTPDALDHFVTLAQRKGERVAAPGGAYHRFSPGAGAELWVQAVGRNLITGVEPHPAGECRLQVRLDARVPAPEDAPLAGAFQAAWAGFDGEDLEDEGSGIPLVFNSPDFRAMDGLAVPARAAVQLAALAYGVAAHPDEDAYYASQGEPKFAPESFVPSGMFRFDDEDGRPTPPEPRAWLSGTVLAAERRTNPATGLGFWWARVRTLGGELDVAADPATVEGEVTPGGVVHGEFWLSGRLADDAPPPERRRPFWRRLAGA
jgi:hypothetical protein